MNSDSESYTREQCSDEMLLQAFCKKILKTKIFRGNYQERRYVESLEDYRDLIVVNNKEKDLKTDLECVRQQILTFYTDENLWVGITPPDMVGAPAAGVCFWTKVEDLAFGNYWFCVKTIRFSRNEIMVKLKVLRPIDNQDDMVGDSKKIEINFETFKSWKEAFSKAAYRFFTNTLCKDNIWDALKFISILMLSLMAASIQAVKFLGIYFLLLMKELRLWVETCKPIILKIIDLLGKLIGAIFIMLYAIYRDIVGSVRGRGPIPSFQAIEAAPQSSSYKRIRRN